MDSSELDRDLNCTPLGDNGELDRPIAKMTFYAPVCGTSGKMRYVSISLPYISAIADEPHYQPPALPEVSFRERLTPGPSRRERKQKQR